MGPKARTQYNTMPFYVNQIIMSFHPVLPEFNLQVQQIDCFSNALGDAPGPKLRPKDTRNELGRTAAGQSVTPEAFHNGNIGRNRTPRAVVKAFLVDFDRIVVGLDHPYNVNDRGYYEQKPGNNKHRFSLGVG